MNEGLLYTHILSGYVKYIPKCLYTVLLSDWFVMLLILGNESKVNPAY